METVEFRALRKHKLALSSDEAKEILKNGEYGVIALIGDNGYPHAVPLNYVYMDGAIYFHCAKTGHKTDSIEKNNKVAFTVVGYHKVLADKLDSEYKSIVVHGRAFEMFDMEKEKALVEMINKYSKGFEKAGQEYIDRAKDAIKIFKIEIEHLTGKGYID
ncbi:pyridoxamine 5'-phosphate oxidase family protein [uncultured Clostridium sp.]|uniref:pyridoxamine 5'-phosphate oxidase family protein n=1 Tax=uncultured Clostridium sp. TaxID=59620 RepID=UPI00260F1408|nr:pyridoxamine 5'-phosphate oxidase family protein [uncultured Clostridium sp.]